MSNGLINYSYSTGAFWRWQYYLAGRLTALQLKNQFKSKALSAMC